MSSVRVPGKYARLLPKTTQTLEAKLGVGALLLIQGSLAVQLRLGTVRIDHLKPLNYSDSECQQMQVICDRIRWLRENKNLEDAPRAMLKYLGELKRPYLTDVEEKLLSVIEQEYGVTD